MAHGDADSVDGIIITPDDPYVDKLFVLIYILSRYDPSLGLHPVPWFNLGVALL